MNAEVSEDNANTLYELILLWYKWHANFTYKMTPERLYFHYQNPPIEEDNSKAPPAFRNDPLLLKALYAEDGSRRMDIAVADLLVTNQDTNAPFFVLELSAAVPIGNGNDINHERAAPRQTKQNVKENNSDVKDIEPLRDLLVESCAVHLSSDAISTIKSTAASCKNIESQAEVVPSFPSKGIDEASVHRLKEMYELSLSNGSLEKLVLSDEMRFMLGYPTELDVEQGGFVNTRGGRWRPPTNFTSSYMSNGTKIMKKEVEEGEEDEEGEVEDEDEEEDLEEDGEVEEEDGEIEDACTEQQLQVDVLSKKRKRMDIDGAAEYESRCEAAAHVDETLSICALDCEMVSTEAGLTLARLTVISCDKGVIMDILVCRKILCICK